MALRNIQICVSDIPRDKFFKSDKSGKVYLNIVVSDKKDGADQYGFDLSVYLQQSEDEREARTEKLYCGRGKTFEFERQQVSATITDDDLPF